MPSTTFQLDGYRITASGKVGACAAQGVPYEAKLLEDIRRLDRRGVAIDVGAHIGNHSLFMAALGYEVLAFEPDPDSFAQLKANIDLNPDLLIHAYPIALGARTQVAKFVSPGTLKVDRGDIPVFAFDEFMYGLMGKDRVGVVKIDVEGMEVAVLRGMTDILSVDRPVVYTEAHTENDAYSQRVVLTRLGYKLTREIKMGSRMLRWDP